MVLLGQIVIDRVIVRFVRDEYVLLQGDVRRRVEGTGRNGGYVLAEWPPKYIAAADTAESPFSALRRLVPDQASGRGQRKISARSFAGIASNGKQSPRAARRVFDNGLHRIGSRRYASSALQSRRISFKNDSRNYSARPPETHRHSRHDMTAVSFLESAACAGMGRIVTRRR
jgi:hypothetical protein